MSSWLIMATLPARGLVKGRPWILSLALSRALANALMMQDKAIWAGLHAGQIHHLEHLRHTFALAIIGTWVYAQQPTAAVAFFAGKPEMQLPSRAGPFYVQRPWSGKSLSSKLPSSLTQYLGTTNREIPPVPGLDPSTPSQIEVDDVFGKVIISASYEYFYCP